MKIAGKEFNGPVRKARQSPASVFLQFHVLSGRQFQWSGNCIGYSGHSETALCKSPTANFQRAEDRGLSSKSPSINNLPAETFQKTADEATVTERQKPGLARIAGLGLLRI